MDATDSDREALYASALDALPATGDDSVEDGQEDPRIDRWLDEQALSLHMQGRTYRDIASLLTISVGGAWKRVQRQQGELEAVEPGDRAEIRNECLLALRMAISSVSEEAADGEPAARVVLNQLANTILRFWKQEDAQQGLPKRARKQLAAPTAEEAALQLPASEPQQLGVCNREQDREQTVNTELQSEMEQEVAREQPVVAQRGSRPAHRLEAALLCGLLLAVAVLWNGLTSARPVEPAKLANAGNHEMLSWKDLSTDCTEGHRCGEVPQNLCSSVSSVDEMLGSNHAGPCFIGGQIAGETILARGACSWDSPLTDYWLFPWKLPERKASAMAAGTSASASTTRERLSATLARISCSRAMASARRCSA